MNSLSGVFVDTNILIYAHCKGSPLHAVARQALDDQLRQKYPLWIGRQILREYFSVMTRPQTFVQALSTEKTLHDIELFCRSFHLAEDGPQVTHCLLELARQYSFAGKQIHDANIVALMQIHRVSHLLTHNISDFKRFSSCISIIPLLT